MSNMNCEAFLKQAGTTYPRVVNLPKSIRAKVNAAIKKTAYEAIPDFDPGTSIIQAQSSYSTQVNMNGVLSLRFQDYYFPEMAAHGATKVTSLTVDLENGHVYDFYELFRRDSNYQARINQIIQAQIASEQIPMLKPFEGVGPKEQYYLTSDSLVIYYQPYVYTPGYYGVLEFKIPYRQMQDIINPRGPIGRILS